MFFIYICIEMEDTCIVDSATTHTILQSQKYFSQLTKTNSHVWTVSGTSNIIEGFGEASFILPNKTHIHIQDALYSSKSTRNLLSFKDIRLNGFHVETTNENEKEYLLITSNTVDNKRVLEKFHSVSSGLYVTRIRVIETHSVNVPKVTDPKLLSLWHERLGHPGISMMRRIIDNSIGHPLKNQKVIPRDELPYSSCSSGKLIVQPSPVKLQTESLNLLERI